MKKLTIEKMQQIAIEHGGKCLSTKYVGAHSKLLWECAERHKWKAQPNNIKNGVWCPTCGFKNMVQTKQKKRGVVIDGIKKAVSYT